jgi:hypothetical protein
MSKLDGKNTMRMNGRVHESFGDSLKRIQERGEHPNLRYAPFTTINLGLHKDKQVLHAKMKAYHEMIILDLEENPFNPGAWVTLGLQYNNDGNPELAKACYERGVMCAGNSYLPYRELALYHLRIAKALTNEVVRLTTKGHEVYKVAEKTLDFLQMIAPGQPFVDSGNSIIGDAPLPDFPFDRLLDTQKEECGDNGKATHMVSLNDADFGAPP